MKGKILIPCLIGLAAILAYSNTFGVPFQFDDLPNIVQNSSAHLTDLSPESVLMAMTGPNIRRPVSNLSFALNFYFHRLDLAGYHLINLFLHLSSGWLVFRLVRNILSIQSTAPEKQAQAEAIALSTSLLFLLHPIQTETVTYIVQRMTGLAGFFCLASVTAYSEGRSSPVGRKRWIFWTLTVLSTLLALGTRESTYVLPVVLLAYEWLFYPDLRSAASKRPWLIPGLLTMICVFALALAVTFWPAIEAGYARRDFTLTERLLTQPRVIAHYISLLLAPIPSRFHLDYDFPISRTFFSPPTTALALIGLAVVAVALWRTRRRWPAVAFSGLWFFAHLSIESSVVPLEMVFEHRMYLPSLSVFALMSAGGLALWRRLTHRSPWLLLVPLALTLAAFTYMRNEVWKSSSKLFKESVVHSPEKARAHQNLGWSYFYEGNLDKAEESFNNALKLEPDNAALYNNLGNIYRLRGDIRTATAYFQKAISLAPQLPDPRLSLAGLHMQQERWAQAEQQMLELLRLVPENTKAHVNLGTIYRATGKLAKAREYYDMAVKIDPGDATALIARGNFLASIGLNQAALTDLMEAVRLAPKDDQIQFSAGTGFESLGEKNLALESYKNALALNPRRPQANFNLSNLYAFRGEMDKAEIHLKRELEIQPHSEAWNNLGNIAWSRGDAATARQCYQKAITVNPANIMARNNLTKLDRQQ